MAEIKKDIINELYPRFIEIERRITKLEEPRELDPNHTTVISRMPFTAQENVEAKVCELLEVMGSQSVPTGVVTRVYGRKKMNLTYQLSSQFRSVQEKIEILKVKPNLRKSAWFKNIYV